jgi:hypothetical protein
VLFAIELATRRVKILGIAPRFLTDRYAAIAVS